MSRRIAFIINAKSGDGDESPWFDANRKAVEAIANGGPVTLVKGGEEMDAAVKRFKKIVSVSAAATIASFQF